MIRGSEQSLGGTARQARRELMNAWDHLLAAAGQGARQVNKTSRRSRGQAIDRSMLVKVMLRGELPALRRRWLTVGFATGAVLGAAGGVMLARRRSDLVDEAAEQAQLAAATVRERAGVAADTVRERADQVAENAATTTRETAARVRENVGKVEEQAGKAEEAASKAEMKARENATKSGTRRESR